MIFSSNHGELVSTTANSLITDDFFDSFSTSRKLAKISDLTALLFMCLIPYCDDGSNIDGDAALAAAFNLSVTSCQSRFNQQLSYP